MKLIEGMLEAAVAAGCPRDQIENFLIARYVGQPKQFAFHAACRECDSPDGPTEVGMGGARGGCKSHSLLAQIILDDCMRQPGLKCLLLRRVGKAIRESFEDLRLRVLKNTPHKYNKSSGVVSLENGSKVVLGHFQTERDVDLYLGMEYGTIGVEEATTLSSSKYKMIGTCNRTSIEGWRPRVYSNANPGGIGHAWYKAKFVIPWQKGEQIGTRFIPTTYRDNAFLNPEYVDRLNALVGWQKRAWRDGDWEIAAGQFFTNFNPKVHIIKAKPIEDYWPEVWLAGDYGWTHPTAILLLVKDLQGNVYVVDEYSAAKRLPVAHDAMIRQMLAHWGVGQARLKQFALGRDAWAKNEKGRCAADSYEELGWDLDQADMARLSGAVEILRLLGDVEAEIEPSLFIYENCTGVIETLPRMEHDPNRPEDVLKVNVDAEGIGGDDFYDCLRYGVMAVSEPTELTYQPVSVPD